MSELDNIFKQEHIDEFKAKVEAKNGHFVKHIYVEQGETIRQIRTETFKFFSML